MNGVLKIDALIVVGAVRVRVHAVKNHVFRSRLWLHPAHDLFQTNAFPFADSAPAFDAIVARDLRARGHGFKFRQRKTVWRSRQARYFQSPRPPLTSRVCPMLHSPTPYVAAGA